LIPIIVIYGRIPKYLYPFIIFVIALSILFLVNLVSTHLWSFDIFFEAYSTRIVLNNGVWIPDLRYKANSLLLITILAPIYSLICGLSYVWVFKIIFPIIFAFTPVALYKLYQDYNLYVGDRNIRVDETIAFLSSLLFIFYYGFFKNMPDKQYIAELFLALVLISIINILKSKDYANQTNTKVVLIMLTFSLVTTHYGVSYLLMIALTLLIIFMYALKYNNNLNLLKTYATFYAVLVLGWYIYVASGNKYETIVSLIRHVVEKLVELQTPIERSGISYILYKGVHFSFIWIMFKLIHIILQVFISIGILCSIIYLIKQKTTNKNTTFLFLELLSLIFYIFLLIQIRITYGMGFDRILQITLTLLSPLALLGCIYIIKKIYLLIFKLPRNEEKFDRIINCSKKFFALFLSIFILFNSGFIFKVCNDLIPPYCIAVNKSAGWPVYAEGEVFSMIWLKSYGNPQYSVSAFNMWHIIKSRDGLLLSEFYPENEIIRVTPNRTGLPHGTYIFLGKTSIEKVKITGLSEFGGYIKLEDTRFYSAVIVKSQKIYDSSDAMIYLKE